MTRGVLSGREKYAEVMATRPAIHDDHTLGLLSIQQRDRLITASAAQQPRDNPVSSGSAGASASVNPPACEDLNIHVNYI